MLSFPTRKNRRKGEPPPPIELLIQEYDTAARDAAMQLRRVMFDHSPGTIETLDSLLGELYSELHRKGLRQKIGLGPGDNEIAQWANLWGVYLGETIRLDIGGNWISGHEEAPLLLALELPDGTVLFPTARVFRRLADGIEFAIDSWYQQIIQDQSRLDPNASSDQNNTDADTSVDDSSDHD